MARGGTPRHVRGKAGSGTESGCGWCDARSVGRVVRGGAVRGRTIFQNLSAICHDFYGRAWNTGDGNELTALGAYAQSLPSE